MPNNPNHFGSFLDKTLQDMKISRSAFATLVFTDRETVKKWCNGHEHPKRDQLNRISNVLSIPLDLMDRRIEDDKRTVFSESDGKDNL